jgi:hypothetical protein
MPPRLHDPSTPSQSTARAATLAALVLLAACRPRSTDEDREPPAAPPAEASETPVTEPEAPRVFSPARPGCEAVPVLSRGASVGSVCVEDAASNGLTVVDLSDAWTPRVLAAGGDGEAPEYRTKYLELSRQPNADLGLYGVSPALSVLAARLDDDKRRTCDASVDLGPIAGVLAERDAAADARAAAAALKKAESKDPLMATQTELACAGLMKPSAATGRMGPSTHAALEAFRRRHMIVGAGLDEDTLRALSLGGEELAFLGLLRGLRERVADAAGLVEDGTASEQPARVLGRELDLSRFAPIVVGALDGGAPDLVDAATDAAALELGWTSPDAVRAFLAAQGPAGLRQLRVAVALPPAPAYHGSSVDLRVEIDRGDVTYDTPGGAAAARAKTGARRVPTFVVYAKDGDREIPLVRWATTIGGWKKERTEDGEIALKYKESDVGERVWRQIVAAPAWMPPDSTPESDLIHEAKDGALTLKKDLIQPGHRNAYGLVMFIHHEPATRGDKETWLDHGIRTHGSVDYRSIKRGTSHGCHRLYNQLALRMSGYLLAHRTTVRRGKMRAGYERTLEYKEQTIEISVPTRGYLYELDPPVPVRVLEGNITGDAQKATSSVVPLPGNEPTKS